LGYNLVTVEFHFGGYGEPPQVVRFRASW
jgi:hypothetical protein